MVVCVSIYTKVRDYIGLGKVAAVDCFVLSVTSTGLGSGLGLQVSDMISLFPGRPILNDPTV